VYGTGTEPDPRFTLANERTFLAWIRTSLALIAGGVALEAFELPISPVLSLASAVILIVLGTLTPVYAWFGWARVERAMRASRPLPSPRLAGPLGVGVGLVGLLLIIGIFVP
jgi:putative membrane protein